jgi:hypothetical protein
MAHKKLLLFTICVASVVGSVSLAFGSPHHSRHHAKAVAADKGGVPNANSDGHGNGNGGGGPADNPGQGNGPDNNPGKGPDDNPGTGDGTPGPNGTPGDGKGQGSDDGNSTGDDPSDSTDSPPGTDVAGNGKGKGADKSGDSGSGGSGKSGTLDSSSNGNGNSNGNGKSSQGPAASVDESVLDDVPAALRSVGVVPLDVLPAELRPSAGDTVLVAPVAGTVLVQNAHGDFVPMAPAARLPVGTVVDASQGVITLVGALANGNAQTAVFSGAKFQIRQAPSGMTALVLRGGSFKATCGSVSKPAGDGPAGPTAGAARVRSKKVVRTLWASDHHGKFQTYGRNSVATVRGTVWETVDRCDGTLTRVAVGKVVVHDRRTGHNVVVTAGHSYLARDPLA